MNKELHNVQVMAVGTSIKSIKLNSILSFGSHGETLDLRPLNVLIGQNAAGKSNLIDIVRLLKSLTLPRGLGSVDISS